MKLGAANLRAIAAGWLRPWHSGEISDPVLLTLYRILMVSLPIALVAWLLMTAAVGAAIFRHPFIDLRGLSALAAFAWGPALVNHSVPPVIALRTGSLSRKGVLVRRDEDFRRYWWSLARAAVLPMFDIAAIGFLLSVALIGI